MRDSDFSSIDDYMSEPTAEDYNDSTTSTGASFGMGSGDGIDSSNRRTMGNAGDFTIGIDPSNITNFIGPLSGNNNVPNVFDLGGGVGDFGFGNTRSQNFLNPQLAEMYKQQEIARTGADLNKNPFAPNIFDAIAKAFGTSVDRTKDLGSQRVQEINDLRARQAFGLPSLNTGLSYTSKDFEAGRDTNQGMVRELPVGGIESFARAVLPGASLLPRGAAPEQSQMYREAQAKANAPGIMSQTGDFLTDIGNLFTGLFSAKPQIEDFDQFSPTVDNRQIEDFSQVGATISDVDPIVNSVKVNREELDSMNRDGTGFASAAGSLYPRTIENSPNYTVPGEENLGMTIDRTGLDRYNLNSVDPNFKTEMNKLNSDEREFLTGRTDTTANILDYPDSSNYGSRGLTVNDFLSFSGNNNLDSKLKSPSGIEGLIKNIAGGDKEADIYIPLSNTLGFTSEDMTSGDSTNSLLYDDKTFKGSLTKGPDNQYSATGGITTPYLDVFGAIQPDGNYSINAGKRFNF